MPSAAVIRKNQYYDSVFLMRVAKNLSDEAGVMQAAAVMGSAANRELLQAAGFEHQVIATATAQDLLVALEAEDQATLDRLLGEVDDRLRSAAPEKQGLRIRSLEEAVQINPQSNLVVISVPGEFAAREARKALEAGKHAFVFSNNVPLEEEVSLKCLARDRRRLLMGPDCGTALIGGIGIGFSNAVRRGPIGVVGPSGTGIQEFTSLVHQAGSGISHAIGTGSHDLSDAVGGISTLMGIEALEADAGTQVIVIVAKPAGPQALEALKAGISRCKKPVVGCFLGAKKIEGAGEAFAQAATIDEAVKLSLEKLGLHWEGPEQAELAVEPLAKPAIEQTQGYLRGLFAGGTFCYQTQQILHEAGIETHSNAPIDGAFKLASAAKSLGHSLIDMGDDLFTQGKPHPMIDSSERRKRILAEIADPQVGILLLDFILGNIAARDPVGDLIGAIQEAQGLAQARGGHLTVLASICGTDADPQGLARQRALLEEAGAVVFGSNASAAKFCAGLLLSQKEVPDA